MSVDRTNKFPKGYDVSEGVVWIPGGNTILIRNITRIKVWTHLDHLAIITCLFASPALLFLGYDYVHWTILVALYIALVAAAVLARKTSLKIFLSDSTYHKASFWRMAKRDQKVHNLRKEVLLQLK